MTGPRITNAPTGLAWLTLLLLSGPAAADATCAALTGLRLHDASVQSAIRVATPVPHCKLSGMIGGTIGFSVWLPDKWNGRFVMGGAGGFVGPEDNQALRLLGDRVLTRGYATASTDTGHRSNEWTGRWALHDLEAIVNYGHLGMHRAVLTAKAAIEARYGKPSEKSFFVGCSNGGRQALQEAQRYPTDFDAIVAGAPALDFSGVAATFVQIVQHMYPDPTDLSAAIVTPDDRALLRRAIRDKCDGIDGVADGYLHDPTACRLDVSELACSRQTGPCLDEAKLAAIRMVYEGPTAGGAPIAVGFPYGAEDIDGNGWGSWLTGGTRGTDSAVPNAAFAFGVSLMRYFVFQDPDWQYANYDFSTWADDAAPVAAVLNATDPDLSAFRSHGGKLLMYHGWSDVALSAYMSRDYVKRVYALDPAAREDVRLFMMPGVLHCYDGPGPSVVDWLAELARWHDSSTPPTQVVATHPRTGATGLLCAWPARAALESGDGADAGSYACR